MTHPNPTAALPTAALAPDALRHLGEAIVAALRVVATTRRDGGMSKTFGDAPAPDDPAALRAPHRPRSGSLLAQIEAVAMLHPSDDQAELYAAGHDPWAVDPDSGADRPRQWIPLAEMLAALRLGASLGGPDGIAALFDPGAITVLRSADLGTGDVVRLLNLLPLPEACQATEYRGRQAEPSALIVIAVAQTDAEHAAKRRRTMADGLEVCLSAPAPLLIIAAPDVALPPALAEAADRDLPPHPLNRAMLAEALRHSHSATGRIAPEMVHFLPDDTVLAQIDPQHLAAVLRRPGLWAGVNRLRAVATKMTAPGRPARPAPVLDDFAGYGEAEATARRMIADLAAWRRGEVQWAEVERSVIFHGRPGCGKSRLAQAMAHSAGVPVIEGNFGLWQSQGHLGHMQKAMIQDFDAACKAAPAILIIDEIDALGDRTEDAGQNRSYHHQVVASFLTQMDRIAAMEGVLVVGTCNYPSRLDPAAIRPGRFDRLVEIGLPGPQAVRKILATCLAGSLPEADTVALARAAMGLSAAQIDGAVRAACSRARTEGRSLAEANVADALTAISGISADTEAIRRVALHECGHAIVGAVLDLPVCTRIILTAGGGETVQPNDTLGNDLASIEMWLTVLMAGRAAERLMLETVSGGAGGGRGSDLARATELAVSIDTQLGLGAEGPVWHSLSPATYLRNPDAAARVRARLEAAEARAHTILTAHAALMDAMAEALIEAGCLEGVALDGWLARLRCDGSVAPTLH